MSKFFKNYYFIFFIDKNKSNRWDEITPTKNNESVEEAELFLPLPNFSLPNLIVLRANDDIKIAQDIVLTDTKKNNIIAVDDGGDLDDENSIRCQIDSIEKNKPCTDALIYSLNFLKRDKNDLNYPNVRDKLVIFWKIPKENRIFDFLNELRDEKLEYVKRVFVNKNNVYDSSYNKNSHCNSHSFENHYRNDSKNSNKIKKNNNSFSLLEESESLQTPITEEFTSDLSKIYQSDSIERILGKKLLSKILSNNIVYLKNYQFVNYINVFRHLEYEFNNTAIKECHISSRMFGSGKNSQDV